MKAEGEDVKAKIKFAGILARAKALSRAPELASIPLPTNVPPPKQLAAMPPEPNPRKPSLPPAAEDDGHPILIMKLEESEH